MRVLTPLTWALAFGPAAVFAGNECNKGTLGKLQPMCHMPSVQKYCDQHNYRKHKRQDEPLPFDLTSAEFEEATELTGVDLSKLFSKRSMSSRAAHVRRGAVSSQKKQHYEDAVCRCYKSKHPKTTRNPNTTVKPSTTTKGPATTTKPSTTTTPIPPAPPGTTSASPSTTFGAPGTTTILPPAPGPTSNAPPGTTSNAAPGTTTAAPPDTTTAAPPGTTTNAPPTPAESTTTTGGPPDGTSTSATGNLPVGISTSTTVDLPVSTTVMTQPLQTTMTTSQMPVSSTTSAETTTTTSGSSLSACPGTGLSACLGMTPLTCTSSGQNYVIDCGYQYQGTVIPPRRRRRLLGKRVLAGPTLQECQDMCTSNSACVGGNSLDNTCTLFSAIDCRGTPNSVPGGVVFKKESVSQPGLCSEVTSTTTSQAETSTSAQQDTTTPVVSTTLVETTTIAETTSVETSAVDTTTIETTAVETTVAATTTAATTTAATTTVETTIAETTTAETTTAETTTSAETTTPAESTTTAGSTTTAESTTSVETTTVDTTTAEPTSSGESTSADSITSADTTTAETTTSAQSTTIAESTSTADSTTTVDATTTADTTTAETTTSTETTTSAGSTTSAETTSTESDTRAESTSESTTSVDTTISAESTTSADSTTPAESTTTAETTSTEVSTSAEPTTSADSTTTSDASTTTAEISTTTTTGRTGPTCVSTSDSPTTDYTPRGLDFKILPQTQFFDSNQANFDANQIIDQTPDSTGSNLEIVNFSNDGWPMGGNGVITLNGQTYDLSNKAVLMSGYFLAPNPDFYTFSFNAGKDDNWARLWLGTNAQNPTEDNADLRVSFDYNKLNGDELTSTGSYLLGGGQVIRFLYLWANGNGQGRSYLTITGNQDSMTTTDYVVGNFIAACDDSGSATSSTTTDLLMTSTTASEEITSATTTSEESTTTESTTTSESTTTTESTTVGSTTTTSASATTTSAITNPTTCATLPDPYTANQGQSFAMNCGYRYIAPDGDPNVAFRYGDVSNFKACIETCSANRNCMAISYAANALYCVGWKNVNYGSAADPTYDSAIIPRTGPTTCSTVANPYTAPNAVAFKTQCGKKYTSPSDNSNVLKTFGSVPDDRACMDICSANTGCIATSYSPTTLQCLLYSDVKYGITNDPTFDAAVRSDVTEPSACSMLSSPYTAPGGTVFTLDCSERYIVLTGTRSNLIEPQRAADSYRACLDRCGATDNCVGSTFERSSSTCSLLNSLGAGSVQDPNFDSGQSGADPSSCAALLDPYTAANSKEYNTKCMNSVNLAPNNANQLSTGPGTTYRACLETCSTTDGCVAGQFNVDTTCTLFSDTSYGFSQSTADTGVASNNPQTAVTCDQTASPRVSNSKSFYKSCGSVFVESGNRLGSAIQGVADLARCIDICAQSVDCFAVNFDNNVCQFLSNTDQGSMASTTGNSASMPIGCQDLGGSYTSTSGGTSKQFTTQCTLTYQQGATPDTPSVSNLIATQTAGSFRRCADICAGMMNCVAITYTFTRNSAGACQLFSDVTYGSYSSTIDSSGAIKQSALINPAPTPNNAISCATQAYSYAYGGVNYEKSCTSVWSDGVTIRPLLQGVLDLEHCIADCGITPGCIGVNFNGDGTATGGTCNMFSSFSTRRAAGTGAVSASRVPSTCGNSGVEWTYYVDSQATYNPTSIKTRQPDASGLTSYISVQANSATFTPYGSTTPVNAQNFLLEHHFYIYSLESGQYTITLSNVDNVASLWVGPNAYSGWTRENVAAEATYVNGPATATFRTRILSARTYTPVRVILKNFEGPGSLAVTVTSPSGTVLVSGTSAEVGASIVTRSCDGTTAPAFPPPGTAQASTCVGRSQDAYNPSGLSYAVYPQDQFSETDESAYSADYILGKQSTHTGTRLSKLNFQTDGWPSSASGAMTLSDGYSFDSSLSSVLMQGYFLPPTTARYVFSLDTYKDDNWGRLWIGDKAKSAWQESNADAKVNFNQPENSLPNAISVQLTANTPVPITYLWSNGGSGGRSFISVRRSDGMDVTEGYFIADCDPAANFPQALVRCTAPQVQYGSACVDAPTCPSPQVRSADGLSCTYPARPNNADGTPPVLIDNPDIIARGYQDDSSYRLTVPWDITLYGTSSRELEVSINGWVTLPYYGSGVFTNSPLPTTTLPPVTFAAYWQDLVLNANTPQGLYSKVTGDPGTRQLNIEYYCSLYSNSRGFTHFILTFSENAPGKVTYTYYQTTYERPTTNPVYGTIGAQNSRTGQSTTWSYDDVPVPGLQITYDPTLNRFVKTPSSA